MIRNPVLKLKEEDLYHLFDRFYKADQSRKGTGLGLAIAKSLLEKMNGSLSAELKENQLLNLSQNIFYSAQCIVSTDVIVCMEMTGSTHAFST